MTQKKGTEPNAEMPALESKEFEEIIKRLEEKLIHDLNDGKKALRKITERLNAIEALQRSEDRFRKLVENTSDLIWEIDENGVNTYMSPKIKDVLGYEPEELIGKRPFDFMLPDEAKFLAGVFKSIASEKKMFSFSNLVNINLHKDGHQVVLETSAVPIFGPGGTFRGYRGIDRDITKRKKTEDELIKINIGVQGSLNKVKLLSGLVPICASCKRILNEKGYWESIEKYIAGHSEAEFSNSVCDECARRLYRDKAA